MRMPVLESIISGECRKSDGSWVFPVMMVNRGKFDRTLPFEWDATWFYGLKDISNLLPWEIDNRIGRDWKVRACNFEHPAVRAVCNELKDVCKQVYFFDNEYRNYDILRRVCDDTLRSLTSYYLNLIDFVELEDFWRDIVHVLGVFTIDFYIEYSGFFVAEVKYDTLRASITEANNAYKYVFDTLKKVSEKNDYFQHLDSLCDDEGVNKCINHVERDLCDLYSCWFRLKQYSQSHFVLVSRKMLYIIRKLEDYFATKCFNLEKYTDDGSHYIAPYMVDFTDEIVLKNFDYFKKKGFIDKHLELRKEDSNGLKIYSSYLDIVIEKKDEFDRENKEGSEDCIANKLSSNGVDTAAANQYLGMLDWEYDEGKRFVSKEHYESVVRDFAQLLASGVCPNNVKTIEMLNKKSYNFVTACLYDAYLVEKRDVESNRIDDEWVKFCQKLFPNKRFKRGDFSQRPSKYDEWVGKYKSTIGK